MNVPLVDLKAQYRAIKPEIQAALDGVLESCAFASGPEVAAFEDEFAAYCQNKHAIAVNSGTSALHLALLAAGIGPGDEVITVPFTFVASVAAIYYVGAMPVYVDIHPLSFTMDTTQIEAAITERTKAIMPVHLYGQTADMAPIMEIARRHKLLVIEDAAQAHGAEYRGRRAGSLADMACFSFYPSKNLGAYGEGGAVVTDNAEFSRKIKMLRDWGTERKYEHQIKGYNYRMEGIQGAVLRVKLRHLPGWNEARRSKAAVYGSLLAGSAVGVPVEMPYARHVYHVYAVRTSGRDALQQILAGKGIQSAIHYPIPVHLQEAYREPHYGEGDFPVSEAAARELLSLPIYPELTREQIEYVCAAIGLPV
jgi:dTDP-4-amino-4,6-dideoxygalactose transaminase